jgi:hypothetical protein
MLRLFSSRMCITRSSIASFSCVVKRSARGCSALARVSTQHPSLLLSLSRTAPLRTTQVFSRCFSSPADNEAAVNAAREASIAEILHTLSPTDLEIEDVSGGKYVCSVVSLHVCRVV